MGQRIPGSLRRVVRCRLLAVALLGGCTLADDSRLDVIKRVGEITVLTYPGTTTYYETPDGPAGFEYDLAKAFADHLGLRLRVVLAEKFADVAPRLLRGEADFAAAGFTANFDRVAGLRFTPPYHHIRYQVIYRLGNQRPTKVEELIGREIEVQTGTPYVDELRRLQQQYPELSWIETTERRPDEHLQLVWEGLLDLTIADSDLYAVNRQHFPELQVAFSLGGPVPLVWAFRDSPDDATYQEAVKFLEAQRRSGELARLIDRYYGPASRSNFVNLTVYRARIYNRLPLYQHLLEEAGKKYDIDWRLLAAMAYQESYWNPKSVSPTGVRGFMMLTRTTARELGIDDRLDVEASIDGGARYLRDLMNRLPARIQEPDRTWLALAAYNVGPAHLEDARILTEKLGGDPDKWGDVKRRLPLLAHPQWYERTRYGYARGHEPVHFVDRVRVYYDILVKIDDEQRARRTVHALKLKALAI